MALEKFRDDPKVGLRLLRFLREEKRLQHLDEVLGPELLEPGVAVIASTNAIHLYPDLAETLASWLRALRPGGHVLINSGNIRNPRARSSEWILDETVWVVGDLAEGLVRTDPAYAAYRADLDDAERLEAHAALPRPGVPAAPARSTPTSRRSSWPGLKVESVREASIEAGVADWYELLATYHDAVLGWVGGTETVDGRAAVRPGRRRPPGADPPRHGRAVPRPADVPGVLDVHHVRQRAMTAGATFGPTDEHWGSAHEAQHRPHPDHARGQPGPPARPARHDEGARARPARTTTTCSTARSATRSPTGCASRSRPGSTSSPTAR